MTVYIADVLLEDPPNPLKQHYLTFAGIWWQRDRFILFLSCLATSDIFDNVPTPYSILCVALKFLSVNFNMIRKKRSHI